ncbi:hypothetical protein Q3G72_034024 [Acer saccharum]|nr:hypothetical protein Q3G72_034024 [Acer saccharum]
MSLYSSRSFPRFFLTSQSSAPPIFTTLVGSPFLTGISTHCFIPALPLLSLLQSCPVPLLLPGRSDPALVALGLVHWLHVYTVWLAWLSFSNAPLNRISTLLPVSIRMR